MSNTIDRRRFLRWLLASTACASHLHGTPLHAAVPVACKPMKPDDDAFAMLVRSTPIVDAHCHIFNATDLPAYQFLEKVVSLEFAVNSHFKNSGTASVYQIEHSNLPIIYGNAKKQFDKYLALFREHEAFVAPSPLESTYLSDRLLMTPGYEQDVALLATMSQLKNQNLDNIELRLLLAVKARRTYDNNDYLRYWARYANQNQGSGRNVTRSEIEAAARRMAAQNLRLRSPIGIIDGVLRFAAPMCKTRTENFLRLRQYYNVRGVTKGGAVRLFTPALVDFDYWVDGPDAPKHKPSKDTSLIEGDGKRTERFGENFPPVKRKRTSLDEKNILMGLLSKNFPGECHSFFGFCPWRVAHKKFVKQLDYVPLDALQDAINLHGFVGVKLYPPMGFRPRNNKLVVNHFDKAKREQIEFHMFPKHLYDPKRFPYTKPKNGKLDLDWKIQQSEKFGAMLDEALEALYTFCIQKNVPIMTHAGPSNFTGGYDYFDEKTDIRQHQFFAEKASIEYWRNMVREPKYAKLRLNLAHAGFHNKKWNEWLFETLSVAPNTFADLSYFENILSGSSAATACSSARRDAVFNKARFTKNPGLWQRFMYGSDWYMMALERYSENYLDVFVRMLYEHALADMSKADRNRRFRAIMAGNAARFLGFDLKDQEGNYRRLLKFYDVRLTKGSAKFNAARDKLNAYADLAHESAA